MISGSYYVGQGTYQTAILSNTKTERERGRDGGMDGGRAGGREGGREREGGGGREGGRERDDTFENIN